MPERVPRTHRLSGKDKLLAAALRLIREKGYAGTTVDDICTAAGLTKGAFFHHFRSKAELAVAAAHYWSDTTAALFAAAPYHEPVDPLERVLAYIDFRKALLEGTVAEFTCLVGTMVQETYASSPAIRDACKASITGHAATLVADFRAAMKSRDLEPPPSAESLALHTQAVIQGAFVLAKASNDVSLARESLDHLRRYFELLFQRERQEI